MSAFFGSKTRLFLSVLAAAFSMLFLAGCDDGDPPAVTRDSQLIGKWVFGIAPATTSWEFKNDGTAINTVGIGAPTNYTWRTDASRLYLKGDIGEADWGIYTVSGNNLTLASVTYTKEGTSGGGNNGGDTGGGDTGGNTQVYCEIGGGCTQAATSEACTQAGGKVVEACDIGGGDTGGGDTGGGDTGGGDTGGGDTGGGDTGGGDTGGGDTGGGNLMLPAGYAWVGLVYDEEYDEEVETAWVFKNGGVGDVYIELLPGMWMSSSIFVSIFGGEFNMNWITDGDKLTMRTYGVEADCEFDFNDEPVCDFEPFDETETLTFTVSADGNTVTIVYEDGESTIFTKTQINIVSGLSKSKASEISKSTPKKLTKVLTRR